jgi:hypothetical protein
MGTVLLMMACLRQGAGTAAEAPPAHFYNAPENLHADPNHVPGDFDMPDTNNARSAYNLRKEALAGPADVFDEKRLFTFGPGELSFSSMKNEAVPVLGYFRNYAGSAVLGDNALQSVEVIVDLNSLDTGVPGRNNRLMAVFFESMRPELGWAEIRFDEFDAAGGDLAALGAGGRLEARGKITLNNKVMPLAAVLNVTRQGAVWAVETAEPVRLLISDFGFDGRIYELMKTCNHKSMSNAVEVRVKLFFK